jgi:hypothetical protein
MKYKLHVSGCLVNLIWGKVTIGQQKFKTEVGNDQLEFTGMIDFLNKVYICVYFFSDLFKSIATPLLADVP